MVSGLVTGALQKLYHQPSLFVYAPLTRVRSLPLLCKKGQKKAQPCPRSREYSLTAPPVHGSPGHP